MLGFIHALQQKRHSFSPLKAFFFYLSYKKKWLLALSLGMYLPIFAEVNESKVPSYLESPDPSLKSYLDLYQEHRSTLGPLGDHREGEIQILLDPKEISLVEELARRTMIQQGADPAYAKRATRVGIISEDHYWYFLRDAVVFPSGFKSLYNRIVEKSSLSGVGGVTVAPLLPDGRIVLILNFRHATRSWELELPRGSRNGKETLEQAACRETQEETGYRLQNPTLLGYTHPASGMSSSVRAVMVGYALEKKPSQTDRSEAIKGVIALTKEQIKQGYKRGFIEINVHGKFTKVTLQDPYLPYVLLVAEEKGFWL